MKKKYFISLAGNIGSGKSTVAELTAERFGFDFYREPVDNNPYLKDFYADMKRYSFRLQIYFLNKRAEDHKHIQANPKSVVQDRSIYEDKEIFAKQLFLSGLLDERDYKTYSDSFDFFQTFLGHPDLLVYLDASVETLQSRIKKRGREFEKSLVEDGSYLVGLKERYDHWIPNYPYRKLTIPMDKMDIVGNKNDLETAIEMISNELKAIK